MIFESILLPIFFLLSSCFLSSIKLLLRKLSAFSLKSELQQFPKYYSIYHLFQYVLNHENLKDLTRFISIQAHILRLCYATVAVIYLLSLPLTSHWIHIQSGHFHIHPFWLILLLLSIVIVGIVVDLIFKIIASIGGLFIFKIFSFVTQIFLLLLAPLAFPILAIHRAITPKLKKPSQESSNAKIKRRLLELLQEGEMNQLLDPVDQKLILSIASFKERIAREVMVPRIQVFALNANDLIFDCASKFIEEGFSRVPVYDTTIDKIIGVLLVKDVLNFCLTHLKDNPQAIFTTPIKELVSEVIYAPETKKISHLLQEFRNKQIHLAIIVDEYGGTEGIVTIEDILEELVGEIADEYDDTTDRLFKPYDDKSWLVDAKMSTIDIEKELSLSIPPSPEYDTIGGYIYHCAGAIPKKGFFMHHEKFDLEVVKSSERAIEIVKITPKKKF